MIGWRRRCAALHQVAELQAQRPWSVPHCDWLGVKHLRLVCVRGLVGVVQIAISWEQIVIPGVFESGVGSPGRSIASKPIGLPCRSRLRITWKVWVRFPLRRTATRKARVNGIIVQVVSRSPIDWVALGRSRRALIECSVVCILATFNHDL